MIRGRWKATTTGLCLLAALSGCQGMQGSGREVDPLLGGAPIPTGTGAGMPYLGRPSVPGEVPPLQTGQTSTSPAALAVGAAVAENDRPAPTVPAVTIQMPRPAGQTPAAPPGVIVPMSATMPAPSDGYSFEQIQQALKARGVTWQQLDMTGKPDEWHFICAIPNPKEPLRRRNYETTMAGLGGLTAMRAVLEQIDRDP